MGEFQSNNIKSRNYNYTVDYFELRAQPGRDTETPGGDTFWYRDDISGLLYPLYVDDALIIGGTSLISDEVFRAAGAINVTEIRIGGTIISEVGTDLVFYDPNAGSITLSSLLTGQWSRDAINGEVYPTILTDNVLIGLEDGGSLRRLQVKAERGDNSSFIFMGTDSGDVETFTVSDQGDVRLRNLYFETDTYMRYLIDGIQFVIDGVSQVRLSQSAMTSTDTWVLNSTGSLLYSKVGTSDGIGFPTADQVAVYLSGSPDYTFNLTDFRLPQENWIYSGKNMIRVNLAGDIELGLFTFEETDKKILFDADTYIYVDGPGNLRFYDAILDQDVTLSQLISMTTVHWLRDEIYGVIYPTYAADGLRIPSLAGAETLPLYIDTSGNLLAGTTLTPVFTANIPVVLASGKTLGKYVNGETIPAIGLTAQEVITDIALEYIIAEFTAFSVAGQSTPIEVGTTLSGTRTFNWTIDDGSGQVDTLDIYDITDASDIATAIANDDSEVVTLNTYQLNSWGATQQWRGVGTDVTPDPDVDFNSSTETVTAYYYRFYGPVAASPTDSASVRALPSSDFQTAVVNTFTLNTGNTLNKFVIALPPGCNLIEVVDLDALGQDITSEYIEQSNINVLDAGSTNRSYWIYEMNIGVPYTVNHRHRITTQSDV